MLTFSCGSPAAGIRRGGWCLQQAVPGLSPDPAGGRQGPSPWQPDQPGIQEREVEGRQQAMLRVNTWKTLEADGFDQSATFLECEFSSQSQASLDNEPGSGVEDKQGLSQIFLMCQFHVQWQWIAIAIDFNLPQLLMWPILINVGQTCMTCTSTRIASWSAKWFHKFLHCSLVFSFQLYFLDQNYL